MDARPAGRAVRVRSDVAQGAVTGERERCFFYARMHTKPGDWLIREVCLALGMRACSGRMLTVICRVIAIRYVSWHQSPYLVGVLVVPLYRCQSVLLVHVRK